MSDIVERLSSYVVPWGNDSESTQVLLDEAAAEIVRLRSAMEGVWEPSEELRAAVKAAVLTALVGVATKQRNALREAQGFDTSKFGPVSETIFHPDAEAATDASLSALADYLEGR